MIELEEKSKPKIRTKLLSPKIDVVFHALFRQENKHLAEKFISAMLGEKIKIKRVDLDRHLDIKSAHEKLGVVDYRAELENKAHCIVEIQLIEKSAEIERFLYYWANTYARQLKRGKDYDELYKTISIIIVDHEIQALKDVQASSTRWKIQDTEFRQLVLTDHLEMCIIELPKAKRLLKEITGNEISQWMWFLDEPNSEEVSEIMQKNKDIQEAVDELEYVSEDEDTIRLAELRLKAIRDERAERKFAIEQGLKEGREKGLQEGLQQGLQQGLQEGLQQGKQSTLETLIKKMLEEQIDISIISKVSGLTVEQILKLK